MSSFLEQVWGTSEGVRCVVLGKMRHTFFGDNKITIPKGKDVWFAPTLFDTDERKTGNALKTKALWLDIDCGKPGTYPTQADAIYALRSFIDETKLPDPTVVNSGNGIHVWWVLDSYLTHQEWQPLAGALRELCVEKELKADHGITIDIARIMRVPGTENHKTKPPKPVELLNEVTTHDLSEITDALEPYIFKAELKTNAKDANRLFSVDLPQTPKDADRIADQCRQLRDFRESKGNLPEPQWYAGLGLLALCTDGGSVAQTWSSGHPAYDPEATSAKLDRAREFAPTTCERFRDVNPDGCSGCPFAGKISSPIQLGELETAVAPVGLGALREHPGLPNEVETSVPLPKGYICIKEGVFELTVNEDDAEAPPKKVAVFRHGVWVSRVYVGEVKGQSEVELSWFDSHGEIETDIVANNRLGSDRDVAKFLRGNNIRYYNLKAVMRYLDAGIDVITKHFRESTVYTRFGMHKKGFVIGSDLIRFDGKTEPTRISGSVDEIRRERMVTAGELSKWASASALLNEPRFWPLRYTVLGALASPIFAVTEESGSILSITGESSGGKTTAANFGASAYGHFDAFTIDPKSTLNGFYLTWTALGNLPMVVNEADRMDDLIHVVYAAANGVSRTVSTQEGQERRKGGWRLLNIFTSNMSLLSMPASKLNTATRNRILELTIDPENMIDLPIGSKLIETAREHYGLAGRELLAKMLPLKDQIAAEVKARTEKYRKTVDDDFRFGLWQIAAADVVGHIAQNLGLIEFEVDDAIENALETLRQRTTEKVDPIARVADFLNNYTNTHQENIGERHTKTGQWQEEPRGEPRGKWSLDNGKYTTLSIAVAPFTAAALTEGIDTNYIKRWVKNFAVESRPERLARSANPVWCYVIKSEHLGR